MSGVSSTTSAGQPFAIGLARAFPSAWQSLCLQNLPPANPRSPHSRKQKHRQFADIRGKAKRPLVAALFKFFDLLSELVAGAGFEPATFGL